MPLTQEEKIIQNEQEDKQFEQQLDKYFNNTLDRTMPTFVCKTPKSLSLAGANESLDITINPTTLDKCTKTDSEIFHGHNLGIDIMKQLPQQLRNPLIILTNKSKNALVAITALKDSENRGVMIAVGLEKAAQRHIVNRITSVYGRNNLTNYLKNQIENGNLIACNKEKAEKMLQSIGLQLPKEETFISYNDSIAYTTANVKYQKKENQRSNGMSEKIPDLIKNELCSSHTEKIEMDKNIQTDREITSEDFEKMNGNERTEKQQPNKTANDIEKAMKYSDLAQVNAEIVSGIDSGNSEKMNKNEKIEKAMKYSDLAQVNAEIIDSIDSGNTSQYFRTEENISTETNDIITMLHSLAESEDKNALNMLGVCYMTGMNVPADKEKALEYFQKSADLDFASAQRNLAIVLEKEENPDKEKITDLYIKSASKGDAYAQNNLGVCYMTGDGVEKNIRKAIQQFEAAVKSGDDFAMVNLADCYSIGNGVRKNDKKAFELYKSAADKGNIDALKIAAECYFNGTGVKQDFEQALNYYKMAADKGDLAAQQAYDKIKDKISPHKHQDLQENPEKTEVQKIDKNEKVKEKVKEKSSHDVR